jgi:hypothetical protein
VYNNGSLLGARFGEMLVAHSQKSKFSIAIVMLWRMYFYLGYLYGSSIGLSLSLNQDDSFCLDLLTSHELRLQGTVT